MPAAKLKWEPAAFDWWYKRLPAQKRRVVWEDTKAEHRKLYLERETFLAFADASGLDIDPRSIENCDPNAAAPSLPDIRCLVSGQEHFFELGEVVDEDLARTASVAAKNREHVYGGAVSQTQPLVRIFLKKCRSRYTVNGRPLHLVLYFSVGHQSPIEPLLFPDIAKWRGRLVERIGKSQFDTVWLYDDWKKRILEKL